MVVKVYLVGGAVREQLLNDASSRTPDLDYLVEGIDFQDLPNFLKSINKEILHIHKNFLVIKAKDKSTGQIEDYCVCRKDVYTDKSTLPEITQGSIYDDLNRRDFTMNAIAYNKETGEYFDPHGGIEDIKNKIIRCVGNPIERFTEDCVRIIRCFRFHLRYGFEIHKSIWETIDNHRNTLIEAFLVIPRDRIINELNRMFEVDSVNGIKLLARLDANLLSSILNGSKIKIKL